MRVISWVNNTMNASSESDSDGDGEWEDVDTLSDPGSSARDRGPEAPAAGIEIVLGSDGSFKGKAKSKAKRDVLQRALAEFARELRHSLHKVHLLCLVAHALLASGRCDQPLPQALLLSLAPRALLPPDSSEPEMAEVSALLRWFVSSLGELSAAVEDGCPSLSSVQLLVCLLRAAGLRMRLVLVLDPMPFRVVTTSKTTTGQKKRTTKRKLSESPTSSKRKKCSTTAQEGRGQGSHKATTSGQEGKGQGSHKATTSMQEGKGQGSYKATLSGGRGTSSSSTSPYFQKSGLLEGGGGEGGRECSPHYAASDEGSEQSDHSDVSWGSDDSDFEQQWKRKQQRSKGKRCRGKGVPATPAKKLKRAAELNQVGAGPSGRGLMVGECHQSEAESVEVFEEKKCCLYDSRTSWAEVYLPGQCCWVPLHLPSSSVGQPQLCEGSCPRKLAYVLAVEHGHSLRDVTARYASDWCTLARRRRLSEEWWEEVCRPYSPPRQECLEEEEAVRDILYSHPLPSNINDYKGHQLFALKRHLLKFEVIYPEESKVLGLCRSEAVFARECVHTLHTRETWLKEGKVVKKGEQPFKIVKARPKKGQSLLERQTATVEVFGRWQTEDYVPLPVTEGKVPRNEYGNVELFQPSMLPPGAAHVKVPGIQRVARELGVDHAPAMMGWDFRSGHCRPVLEGVVVAEENEDLLLEAWYQAQQLQREKKMQRRQQRVLERWRKMVRGALIRERVRRKYLT